MSIETFHAINGLYLTPMMIIEILAQITSFLAIAGFTIYLAGITWSCTSTTRKSIRQTLILNRS